MQEKNIAVVGAGVIGRTHVDAIRQASGVRLSGIVEPGPGGRAYAEENGCRLHANLDELIASRPDGVVVATPNETHAALAMELLAAGIPVLVEKPLATTVAEAASILKASEKAGVPVLTAHHRRYNERILKARQLAGSRDFGHLVIGSVLCSLKKPASYFDVAWRTLPGSGGPLLINMIHEIDLLRFLFGEVASVNATQSNAERGLPVEDTAGAILRFEKGGIITLAVSDAAAAPWAWDISANENPGRFPAHPVSSHHFCGSDGAFSLPDLTFWFHGGEKSWTEKMQQRAEAVPDKDAYIAQISHFAEVIDGKATPRCSGLDGARNIAVIEAIRQSAITGKTVELDLGFGTVAPDMNVPEEAIHEQRP